MLVKKKVKRIAACLLFCVMFTGCGEFFRYILIDDTDSYTRIQFHEMYEQENIDVLFVGSSHCELSFVPEIFDDELGIIAFNGGTGSQRLDGSYMIIKEAARYNDIKHIYLELYYVIAYEAYKTRTDLGPTYNISDYLRPSPDKYQYLLDASAKDYYLTGFIPARRNWAEFFDADYVKELLIKKGTDAYINYEYTYVTEEASRYAGKGYVAYKRSIENWNYFSPGGWGNINLDNVSDDWRHSLEEIIAFCDKRNIPLTLISAPVPNFLLAGAGNYDEYVGLVQSVIEGTNVDYYDFNLCKETYFPNTSSLFADDNHLNCYGAESFSHLLADLINGIITEDELFYASYDEKLENLEPTVFGISYHDDKNEDGETVRNCKIVSTGNKGLEYEISSLTAGGEFCRIQDFSDNSLFAIASEEHGTFTIAYRLTDCPYEIWTVDIVY